MAVGIPQAFRPEMTLVLAFGVFLLGHAVHVPSVWGWTVALGAAMAVPLLWGTWEILNPMDPRIVEASAAAQGSVQTTAASVIGIGIASVITWWVVIVSTAATTSAVIYGLRHEVRTARRLGQYTLEEKLGEGSMGVVYRATHAMLRRATAVKLLLPDRMGEESLKRFELEVQSTARLAHPNTVRIFDYGHTEDGLFYYAMELLHGASLARVVEFDGPLTPTRAHHILYQVAGALAEAHGCGLIHRDIKPANVMLTVRGGVPDYATVVDFGLVKNLVDEDPSLSTTGTIVGTPTYLAPEVIRGLDADRASRDLYALGCLAFFLLTGEDVFTAATAVQVCALHLEMPPELPSKRLGKPIPPKLEALVMSLLAKDAADRPASALAVMEYLEGLPTHGQWRRSAASAWWASTGEKMCATESEHPDLSASQKSLLTVDLRDRPVRRTSSSLSGDDSA
jgi:serine/threonine-protein kinase